MTEKEFIDICQSYGFVKSTYHTDCDMTFPEYPHNTFVRKNWSDSKNKVFQTVTVCYPLTLVGVPSDLQIGAHGTKIVETVKLREFLAKMKLDYKALRKELRLNKIKEL